MTNTLHRYGSRESLSDDYIVFIMPARGINDQGCEPKLHAFLEAALKYKPVNMGHASHAGIYRPFKGLNPFTAYFLERRHSITPQQLVREVSKPGTQAVVFDNRQAFEGFLGELRRLDLGLSANASALVDDVRCACRKVGIVPHSVEYSLGFRGRMEKLPTARVLELSTMCGHGMVSANFAKKMMDMVKEGRLTSQHASQYMAKFCMCGVFNLSRAKRILEEARRSD